MPSPARTRNHRLTSFAALFLTILTAQAVLIGWDPAPRATGYVVYWRNVKAPIPSEMILGTNLSATIAGLTAGEEYWIAVSAYNTAGESDQSEPIFWTQPFSPLVTTLNLQETTDLAGPWTNRATISYTNTPSGTQLFYRAFLTITNVPP